MENDKRISNIENRVSRLEDEVQELHKNTAVSKQEIKMIFNILNEIKDSIKDIAKDLGNLKSKPLEKYEKIAMIVISAVVGFLVSKWF